MHPKIRDRAINETILAAFPLAQDNSSLNEKMFLVSKMSRDESNQNHVNRVNELQTAS
uniref:Uncharacterized protein n=1 Tax=Arundo donax TaxID=35708 RepID=A0A0A9CLB6_ARUDO